ncbi:MAG TPA: hypothetical protein VIG36_03555 [Methylocystis sp.]
MKSHNLKNWTLHGEVPPTPLLAETFPKSGVHFIVGEDETARGAIIADLALALASDSTTCGLGPIGENGVRASLSGWFDRDTGERCGVAIVAGQGRADTLRRAVTVNALARGVRSPLPIALTEVRGAAPLFAVPKLLRELSGALDVPLGLVALDELAIGAEAARAIDAIQSTGAAVLLVGRELPSGLIGPQSVVVEVSPDRIDVTPPQGEPWAREFSLDRVILPDADALAARPGKAAPAAPSFLRPAPAAPIVREPPQLPPIVSKAVHFLSRGLADDIATRYRAAGFLVLRNPGNGLCDLPDDGRREISIVGVGGQRNADIQRVANSLRQEAIARGVNDRVVIRVGDVNDLSKAA